MDYQIDHDPIDRGHLVVASGQLHIQATPRLATVLAMAWVSWLGRAGRGQVDREVAVRRLGDAMARSSRVTPRNPPAYDAGRGERSTGVAVRPSSRPGPTRRAS